MSNLAKCPLCGLYIDVTFTPETCPQCSGNLIGREIQPENYSPLTGVGGWLLLLCVWLTIIAPALSLLDIAGSVREAAAIDRYSKATAAALWIAAVVESILMLAGICAGVALWSETKRAVKIARFYLIALVVIRFALLFLAVNIVPRVAIPMIVELRAFGIVLAIISVPLGYLYLSKSDRVSRTYPPS